MIYPIPHAFIIWQWYSYHWLKESIPLQLCCMIVSASLNRAWQKWSYVFSKGIKKNYEILPCCFENLALETQISCCEEAIQWSHVAVPICRRRRSQPIACIWRSKSMYTSIHLSSHPSHPNHPSWQRVEQK